MENCEASKSFGFIYIYIDKVHHKLIGFPEYVNIYARDVCDMEKNYRIQLGLGFRQKCHDRLQAIYKTDYQGFLDRTLNLSP